MQAAGEALVAAVRGGAAAQAASLTAQLSQEGSAELVGQLTDYLSSTGVRQG